MGPLCFMRLQPLLSKLINDSFIHILIIILIFIINSAIIILIKMIIIILICGILICAGIISRKYTLCFFIWWRKVIIWRLMTLICEMVILPLSQAGSCFWGVGVVCRCSVVSTVVGLHGLSNFWHEIHIHHVLLRHILHRNLNWRC